MYNVRGCRHNYVRMIKKQNNIYTTNMIKVLWYNTMRHDPCTGNDLIIKGQVQKN